MLVRRLYSTRVHAQCQNVMRLYVLAYIYMYDLPQCVVQSPSCRNIYSNETKNIYREKKSWAYTILWNSTECLRARWLAEKNARWHSPLGRPTALWIWQYVRLSVAIYLYIQVQVYGVVGCWRCLINIKNTCHLILLLFSNHKLNEERRKTWFLFCCFQFFELFFFWFFKIGNIYLI